jgi:hypothetical protein
VEEDEKLPQGEILFLQVVSMFQAAAMQQMGKIPSPLTGRIERDLEQAKMSVDILAMLKEKTAGNLTKRESGYLGKALFECQMNYLDELKRPEPEAAGGGDGEGSAEESPEGGGNARPGAGGGGEDEKGEER